MELSKNELNDHKESRIAFCNLFTATFYDQITNIIFTDESSVCIDPRKKEFGGIEDRIGSRGYIKAEKYVCTLTQNGILGFIEEKFGQKYIWMQNNEPSHVASLTADTLLNFVPKVLDWPPRSHGFNPIEHLWDYLKDRIGNEVFQTQDQLFNLFLHVVLSAQDIVANH